MLLAAIDENHRGTYDFLYLPIDFKVVGELNSEHLLPVFIVTEIVFLLLVQNKCNVGYAFINMLSPSHIIPFYKVWFCIFILLFSQNFGFISARMSFPWVTETKLDNLLFLWFAQNFNGKKWEKFNSEKVASLAYARIQGKAALVAHFQNSSLMNEDKWCRPILFTSEGSNAVGQVINFSSSPNYSKATML